MPQLLAVCNVKFCHLRHPVVGKVKVGGVVSDESGQLQKSVGEGEGHRLVATEVSVGDGKGEPWMVPLFLTIGHTPIMRAIRSRFRSGRSRL